MNLDNTYNDLSLGLFGLGLFILYMFPTVVAMLRRNKNTLSIGVLNFFLAWTILGWIFALVWAFKKNK